MRRGRSQEPSCGAGKPTSKPEGPGPPFWLGRGQGVTPESTSQAQFRSASARRVPKAKASRREASHEERESRGEPRLGSKPKTAQAVASPSRFGDNPRSLQEQVAQESLSYIPRSPRGSPRASTTSGRYVGTAPHGLTKRSQGPGQVHSRGPCHHQAPSPRSDQLECRGAVSKLS
ncbi:unnamed protein product [Effrenium voratum]|nr:unnamed protein product [Effrenium voratum]